MRCRRHRYDASSSIGICASCIRERLSFLFEAEAQRSFQTLPYNQKQQSNPPPPPKLLFPRSVSPYTTKRHLQDQDASDKHGHWGGIFSTPQFEMTSTTKTTKIHTAIAKKFAVITKLLKSKSTKHKTDEDNPAAPPTCNSVSSPFWFNSLRRKSKFSELTTDHTPHSNRCIGISPNRTSCDSPISGYPVKKKSTSSSSSRRVKSAANFTGLIFGLSPLVQPSPIRLRSQNSYSSESFSCELRVPAKATTFTSSSLRGSKSRKLAESQSIIYPN